MNLRSIPSIARASRGTTLIELLTVLAIGALVVSILYMLVDASTRGGRVVQARVSDQEEGRHALAWMADRLRQASYDPFGACPDGIVRIGTGETFSQRLAFRAVIDERAVPSRRIYVFYRDGDILWQETISESPRDSCDAEAARPHPDPHRVAITRPIVKSLKLQFFGRDGHPTGVPAEVRSIGIALRLETASTRRQVESQTFHTLVALRGP